MRCGVAVPGFAVTDCAAAAGDVVGGGVEWRIDCEGAAVRCYCAGGAEGGD